MRDFASERRTNFWEPRPAQAPPLGDPVPIIASYHFGPGIAAALQIPGTQTLPIPDGAVSPAEAINARISDTFRAFGVPETVLAQRGQPVSETEYRLAQHKRESLMKDKEWQRKYFDGDQDARRTMATISIILGSPIKQDDANG